jgi:TRAP-type C4-dicarboxylate transport system permease small subunit
MGIGGWTIIAILLALLAAALAFAYYGWTYDTGEGMPISLWVPMGLGIFFSLVVGCGLMALVFYSSRKGYDEAANIQERDHDER